MSRALACIELSSIARGVRVLDILVKRAPVALRHHARHSSGKYVVLFEGDVADVEESFEESLAHCGDLLLDHMLLAHPHEHVWRALDGDFAKADSGHAALMVETTTLASNIESLDFAAKLVEAHVVDWQLGNGIGGKGYFAVQGPQYDLEYLRDELLVRLNRETLICVDLIPNPHPEMLGALGHAGPFAR